jgi:hypothetical protein
MARHIANKLPALDLPDPDRAVHLAGGEELAVGRESESRRGRQLTN